MKKWLFSLLMPVSLIVTANDIGQTGNRGEWRTLAPLPTARQEISAAALDGKIYAIAGFNSSGGNANNVDVYDPQSNAWTPAAPLPIATNHNAAAVVSGRLYAFGGTSNRCFVYNQPNNTWGEVAPMRFQHGNTPAVGVIGDKLYVAGGTGTGMNQTELEVYDPVGNTWTQLASMSVPRNHTAGGVIDGKFYVAGGRGVADSMVALEVYDPADNRWRRLPDLPTGRSGIAAGVVNGELYVFGGEMPRMFNEVEVYNPLANAWTRLPPMPVAKHGIFAAVLGNTIYLPGGATAQGLGATTNHSAYAINTATTVSAASFDGKTLASQAIVAAFGPALATTTQSARALPLPSELGGTTVRVTDNQGATRNAPLFFVSPQQVNYQLPAGTAPGLATVQIVNSDARLATGVSQINAASPGFFTFDQNGRGAAVALDAFTFALPPFNARRANGEPNVIAFYATGLGADVTDADGNAADSVRVVIGESAATVLYAGRAPGLVGANQLNVQLPANITAGVHTVTMQRNGVNSNVVTIAIR
jgi:uncharacterized protein (TIGR03437 family)